MHSSRKVIFISDTTKDEKSGPAHRTAVAEPGRYFAHSLIDLHPGEVLHRQNFYLVETIPMVEDLEEIIVATSEEN